ncbi:MAG: dihydropteroate synthase [Nitrososphaeraceae archaeon]|jgi:dihydropteroate synthase
MTNIGRLRVGDNAPVRVMGIINVSPESFYKRSVVTNFKDIAKMAQVMEDMGASLIDIGAMSTAPYLQTVIPLHQEVKRMVGAVKAVKISCNVPVLADTPRAAVAREAIKAGADAINDISGLKYDANMATIVADSKKPIILGAYGGPLLHSFWRISATKKFLQESLAIARGAKIAEDKMIVDPSIGFFRSEGKNPFFTKIQDRVFYIRDIEAILNLRQLKSLQKPICISVSRKSFIGHLLNSRTQDRLIPSIVAEIKSAKNGANIIRTHDVKQTIQGLIMAEILDC